MRCQLVSLNAEWLHTRDHAPNEQRRICGIPAMISTCPLQVSSHPAHHTMPGLLDTKGFHFYSLKFAIAVMAEMLGVLVFAFYSSSSPSEYAAWANGLSLAVAGRAGYLSVVMRISREVPVSVCLSTAFSAVYITANISGGHLNPAVTVATVCTGHISLLKAGAYIAAQIVGAILAHLIQVSLLSWLRMSLHTRSIMPAVW